MPRRSLIVLLLSASRSFLRSHSRKHQETEFKFSCEHCDYKTKLSGHLKRHIRVHEREEGKIYQCPHCDYSCNNSVSSFELLLLNETDEFLISRKTCGSTSWRPTSTRASSCTSASSAESRRCVFKATPIRNFSRTCCWLTEWRRRQRNPSKPFRGKL